MFVNKIVYNVVYIPFDKILPSLYDNNDIELYDCSQSWKKSKLLNKKMIL